MSQPLVIKTEAIAAQKPELFPDLRHGTGLSWKTLTSASKTPTDTFTTGIATCVAGNSQLPLHQHTHPETYYIIKGEGVVEIEGGEHLVEAGSVVFIPSNALHGVRNTNSSVDLVWFYVFAADDFSEVKYRFLHDAAESL